MSTRPHDKQTSETATKAFLRHTWFLTDDMIPLALFSTLISDEEKAERANKIIRQPKQPPQIEMPTLPPLPAVTTNLAQFVGPNSWLTISRFGSEWLAEPVAEWENNSSFQT